LYRLPIPLENSHYLSHYLPYFLSLLQKTTRILIVTSSISDPLYRPYSWSGVTVLQPFVETKWRDKAPPLPYKNLHAY